jgi:hypothetical protein
MVQTHWATQHVSGNEAAIATMRSVCKVCGREFAPGVAGPAPSGCETSCQHCGRALAARAVAGEGGLAAEIFDYILLFDPALDLPGALKTTLLLVAHFMCWLG